ncbi:hypothetical protein D3C73_1572150 [compost metagenome]
MDIYPGTFVKYSNDDNNVMSLNNTNIMNLANTTFAKWVTKGAIEAEWDSYVKESQKAGIDKNLEIMQKYYDEFVNQ